ncbi:MAG: hypothetical protein EHM31_13330 [Candidatus Aminicenantes bacterium]|nr:MAG: hypothetical protein EHM31_13330 [Candidatus Aminicenantes bacterium]
MRESSFSSPGDPRGGAALEPAPEPGDERELPGLGLPGVVEQVVEIRVDHAVGEDRVGVLDRKPQVELERVHDPDVAHGLVGRVQAECGIEIPGRLDEPARRIDEAGIIDGLEGQADETQEPFEGGPETGGLDLEARGVERAVEERGPRPLRRKPGDDLRKLSFDGPLLGASVTLFRRQGFVRRAVPQSCMVPDEFVDAGAHRPGFGRQEGRKIAHGLNGSRL